MNSANETGRTSPAERDLLAAALEALDHGVVVFDREGILRRANAAAARIVGRSAAELVGRRAPEWEALLGERLTETDTGTPGSPDEAGTLYLRTVGYPRQSYARRVETLRDGGGAEIGRVETLREVTREVAQAQECERMKEAHAREMAALEGHLEQVEKFKMELTANVTHDLRTPLASIKASVSGLLAGDVSYDPQALRETLSLIEDETDRLQRRVQNLLSMASMESGGAMLNRDWVDIPDVAASALESLRSIRGDRPVRLQFPDDLPFVRGDYDQIQIALRNLMENAFLYAPPESPVDVSASVGLGHLRVRVRDYGAGLMPDESEKIFDKFYRGRSARRIPGTGLGLAICRGIAEAHGGRLWAEHVPGGGVAFVLSLPLGSDEMQAEAPGEPLDSSS